jgi:hypothetical protein
MLIAASILGLSAGPALAADLMAGYYGNTVIVTGPGLEVHVHYRADHTLDLTGTRSGTAFKAKGTWAIDKNGQLCRTYETPPPGVPNPFCTPLTAHKLGDAWSMQAAGGGLNQARMVGGVH